MVGGDNVEMIKPKFKQIERSTLTVEEIAKYIGISKEQIYLMVREKRIPCFRIGRRILFKRESIDRWIEDQMQEVMEDDY